ncbi:MAG: hypothetical protein IT442_08130 [Phycisphaeraceae bacterium]|nr:hypothetical protein [Phycisphaeraceae bacterium]
MTKQRPTSSEPIRSRRPRRPDGRGGGFTLIEMLVVVGLMILLMGLGVPTIVGMIQSGRIEAGVNTVSAVITVSQARTPSPTPAMVDLNATVPGASSALSPGDITKPPGLPLRPVTRTGDTAILFTPSGEIRFLEVDETAVDTSGNPLSRTPEDVASAGNPPKIRYRVAFKDRTDVESIRIPSGLGVVGITRGGSGAGDVILLPPPFAIRFDRQGRLVQARASSISGSLDWGVFYNGDYSVKKVSVPGQDDVERSEIDPASNRDNSSELPDAYDRNSPLYDSAKTWTDQAKTANKAVVPIEAVDTVVGVILYDKNKFYGNFTEGWPAYRDQDVGQPDYDACCEWVLTNGKPVFFSRYSGSLLME